VQIGIAKLLARLTVTHAPIILDEKSIEQRCFEFLYEQLNLAEMQPESSSYDAQPKAEKTHE
jgi:hypothetical protein